jgi:hypothetical protein
MFGPKRDEVTGEWRKLHSEDLQILYSSPNIIRRIKSGRIMGGTCGTHGKGKHTGFSWKSPKERDHLRDQRVDRRMRSEWILGD